MTYAESLIRDANGDVIAYRLYDPETDTHAEWVVQSPKHLIDLKGHAKYDFARILKADYEL